MASFGYSSDDSREEFRGFHSEDLSHTSIKDNYSDIEVSAVSSVASDDLSSDSDEEFSQTSATSSCARPPSSWTKDLRDQPKEPFTGPDPGPTTTLDKEGSELNFFQQFMPAHVIEVSQNSYSLANNNDCNCWE